VSFAVDKSAFTPQDANGRPFVLSRAIKIFENNNMATLESDVNTFLNSLKLLSASIVVFDVTFIGVQASSSRIMVSYGIFNAAVY
jgi:hypothetical protein